MMVGPDTLVEAQGDGTLDAETLAFLTDALRHAGDTPVLLALHHPPFETGIQFMDKIGLQGINALTDVVSCHSGDIHIACGQIHCLMMANVGPKVAISALSPCSSFAFDLRADAPVGCPDAENGFLVHRRHNGFPSVRIGINSGAGPFPF